MFAGAVGVPMPVTWSPATPLAELRRDLIAAFALPLQESLQIPEILSRNVPLQSAMTELNESLSMVNWTDADLEIMASRCKTVGHAAFLLRLHSRTTGDEFLSLQSIQQGAARMVRLLETHDPRLSAIPTPEIVLDFGWDAES